MQGCGPPMNATRFRLLRGDDDPRDTRLSRTEATLRATARQQEAVAHLGQQALAGAPVRELMDAAVTLAARVLEVEFGSVLEDRPFGILGAHSARRREFTIHDTHFLQALANVLATAIDRTATEEALRRSEEHFRSLIENASDIVTIVGDNGVFRYASPSVERVLGYAPVALLERNAFDLVHPEDIALVAEALARTIHHPGVPQAAQFRFRARDGVWRLLEAVGQARVGPGDA